MSIERPNYGEDYVKNEDVKSKETAASLLREDFRVHGLCSANKLEKQICVGYRRIIEGCYFYNLFTGKCMRPEDKQEGGKNGR